jgi:hypothetical protein
MFPVAPATLVAARALETLIRFLSMKGDLDAIWKAGDWLHTHLGGKPADRGHFKIVLEAAQKFAEKNVPVSMNHLQKCRQFRRLWDMNEVKRAANVGMPWRRAIQLTVIKHHAAILKTTSATRAAQIRRKCDALVKSFPGSNKQVMPAWAEKVEKLKRECLSNNPGARKYHTRLWVDCWKAAVFRLDEAGAQIDKMSRLLADDSLKRRAEGARRRVDAALVKLKRIYSPPKRKPKKT